MDVYAQLARNKSKQHQRPTNLTLGGPPHAQLAVAGPHAIPPPLQVPQVPQPIVRHSTGLSPPPIPSILGSPPPPSPPLPPQQASLPTRFLRSLSSTLLVSLPGSADPPAAASTDDARSTHSTGSTGSRALHPSSSSTSLSTSSLSGPPRTHWRPDDQVSQCVECGTLFGLLQRRHHCRKCGDIFCAKCSAFQARLDDALQFSDHAGHLVRVCKVCHRAADRDRSDPRALRREVERLRKHKLMLESERNARGLVEQVAVAPGGEASSDPQHTLAVAAPGVAQSQPMAAPARPQQPGTNDAKDGIGMLGSVPSDWNWSTF